MDKIDSLAIEKGEKLPLVEEFYSVQGEGYHTGKAAYFIRIGGCDIGCSWCDSKITWNPEYHPLVPIEDIVNNALNTKARAVVVTGGEPSLYNLAPLTSKLKENGIEIFLETAGTNHLTGEWDWICLSPKKQSPPVSEIYNAADELKVIIFSDDDFEWAEEAAKHVGKRCKLYLQSEWSMYKNNISKIVDYVKENPKWNISLQAHKFMNIP